MASEPVPRPDGPSEQNQALPSQEPFPLTFPEYDPQSALALTPATFSTQIQFQVPQFIFGGPPNLPPGGGAEATIGMLPSSVSSSIYGPSWFPSEFARNARHARWQQGGSILTDSLNTCSSTNHQNEPVYSILPDSDLQAHTTSFSYPNCKSPLNDPSACSNHHDRFSFANQAKIISVSSDYCEVAIPAPLRPLLYSASGFDVLGILAKVVMRPNPKISLGPVDFTCSFCFVDIRRHDAPIVYASPSFFALTGYSENEVLGRNCRFLQSPDGVLAKGDERKFTSVDGVQEMKNSTMANKECQVSLTNYRKGGRAFLNLVTIVPVPVDDSNEIGFHVGFQVDLTDQPNAILQRLHDGSYLVDYSSSGSISQPNTPVLHRPRVTSKEIMDILSQNGSPAIKMHEQDQTELNSFLLENTDDFMHVLSLKGLFQYVSPSVRKVLEYEAEELIGKSISEICHPADVTPLMRELKESSAATPSTPGGSASSSKTVNLFFRAKAKRRGFVWIEAHGRLHVEPGKGRKSIVLCARARSSSQLLWGSVFGAGGFSHNEFWGLLSTQGLWLRVSSNATRILDSSVELAPGSSLLDLLPMHQHQTNVLRALQNVALSPSISHVRTEVEIETPSCRTNAQLIFYSPESEWWQDKGLFSLPIMCQVKIGNAPFSDERVPRPGDVEGPSVFDEFDVTRHSSWQYELTNLKMANKILRNKIAHLEAIRDSNLPSQASQDPRIDKYRKRPQYENPVSS